MKTDNTLYTHHQNNNEFETEENKTEKILLRRKLVLLVSCMLIIGVGIQGYVSVTAVNRIMAEQAESALIDKAEAVTDMLDKETSAFFQYAELLAHASVLNDSALSNSKKVQIVYNQTAFNDAIRKIAYCDMNGRCFLNSGEIASVSNEEWFRAAASGKRFVSEPAVFSFIDKASLIFAVPVYMNDKITGVVGILVSSDFFSEKIESVTVGYTGYCSIFGLTGVTIAHRDHRFVDDMYNIVSEADTGVASFKAFIVTALANQTGVGYYTFMNFPYMAAYTTMRTTGWTVIFNAPEQELTGGTTKKLMTMFIITNLCLLITLFTITRIVIRKMI